MNKCKSTLKKIIENKNVFRQILILDFLLLCESIILQFHRLVFKADSKSDFLFPIKIHTYLEKANFLNRKGILYCGGLQSLHPLDVNLDSEFIFLAPTSNQTNVRFLLVHRDLRHIQMHTWWYVFFFLIYYMLRALAVVTIYVHCLVGGFGGTHPIPTLCCFGERVQGCVL